MKPNNPSTTTAKKRLQIEVISGVEGKCLSMSIEGSGVGKRVAGPKPWGGGSTIQTWYVDPEELIKEIQELNK